MEHLNAERELKSVLEGRLFHAFRPHPLAEKSSTRKPKMNFLRQSFQKLEHVQT